MTVEIFGSRLRSARDELGLSQPELGKRLGVSGQTIKEWEKGRSAPPLGKLDDIARELGRSVEWFFHGEESTSPKPGADLPPPADERELLILRIISNISEQNGKLVALSERLESRLSRMEEKLDSLGIVSPTREPAPRPKQPPAADVIALVKALTSSQDTSQQRLLEELKQLRTEVAQLKAGQAQEPAPRRRIVST